MLLNNWKTADTLIFILVTKAILALPSMSPMLGKWKESKSFYPQQMEKALMWSDWWPAKATCFTRCTRVHTMRIRASVLWIALSPKPLKRLSWFLDAHLSFHNLKERLSFVLNNVGKQYDIIFWHYLFVCGFFSFQFSNYRFIQYFTVPGCCF